MRNSKPRDSRTSYDKDLARLKSLNTFDKVESLLNLQATASQLALLVVGEDERVGHSPALAMTLNDHKYATNAALMAGDARRANQSMKMDSQLRDSQGVLVGCPIHGADSRQDSPQLHSSYSTRGHRKNVKSPGTAGAMALAREASLRIINEQLQQPHQNPLSRVH